MLGGTSISSRRSGGRADRLAKRAAAPVIDPCPPGQLGGQYAPLSEPEIKQIYDTALRLLAELGMGEVPDRLTKLFVAAGCTTKEARVMFPRALVKNAIAGAAQRFRHWICTAMFTGRPRCAICMISRACKTHWQMSAGLRGAAWPQMWVTRSIWTLTPPMRC